MNSVVIKQQLSKLKLSVAAAELDQVLKAHPKRGSLDWLSTLLEREIDARGERTLRNKIRRAGFPRTYALEQFDWDFDPSIERAEIEECASLAFIERHEIVLLLGKPGTGKTHVAVSIGHKAIHAGKRVYYSTMKKLIADIRHAQLQNNLQTLFKRILGADLWILDDWAVTKMPASVAEEVFDLLDRRISFNSLLLTSNRDVTEWPPLFQDPVLASAAIDRIFDRPTIIPFTGKSYRAQKKSIKSLEQKSRNVTKLT